MKIREDILEAGYVYHIYNRGINSRIVFMNDENYRFFLEKVSKYILPDFDVFAYCLMPTHFHLVLRPKEITKLNEVKGLHGEDAKYSKALAKLISSYTQAFNKVYQHTGPIFESPFKRLRIDSEEYLRNLIIYVHQNPSNFRSYRHSSFQTIVSNSKTKLSREEVLSLFEGKENFLGAHSSRV